MEMGPSSFSFRFGRTVQTGGLSARRRRVLSLIDDVSRAPGGEGIVAVSPGQGERDRDARRLSQGRWMMAPGGRPALFKPSRKASKIAQADMKQSAPGRKMQAFPAFTHKGLWGAVYS